MDIKQMKSKILGLSLLLASLLFVSTCKDDAEDAPVAINFPAARQILTSAK